MRAKRNENRLADIPQPDLTQPKLISAGVGSNSSPANLNSSQQESSIMENRQFVRQIIELNRESVDTIFDTLTWLHMQTEKMTDRMINNGIWLPEEGRNLISEWNAACRKGQENLKKSINAYFEQTAVILKVD
ncbi:MAG: hypothetical protein ACOZF0_11475 [Thermodesulfobacteriota bacterium]